MGLKLNSDTKAEVRNVPPACINTFVGGSFLSCLFRLSSNLDNNSLVQIPSNGYFF